MNADQPRVLHIVPQLFGLDGLFGGAERYALELSRAMARRTPTRLVAFGAGSSRQVDGPLEIFTIVNQLPRRRFQSSPCSLDLLHHLRWADVVHCHQTFTMAASLALLYGRLCGKPIFTTDHGGGGPCLHGYLPRFDRWFAGHLWVSRFSQQLAGALQPRDAVIWGGVDTQLFQPGAGVERDLPVLFVGRLLPHKGIHVLIRAAALAGIPLTVVGHPGPGEEYLDKLRRQALDSPEPVTFVTDTDDVTLRRYYQRARCVVLPSVPQSEDGTFPAAELLGQTLLEAMASGAPVIASRFGGIVEVVDEGRTGALVPPGDATALAKVLAEWSAEPAVAQAMGEAARAHVQRKFTWDGVVERCLASYAGPGDEQ